MLNNIIGEGFDPSPFPYRVSVITLSDTIVELGYRSYEDNIPEYMRYFTFNKLYAESSLDYLKSKYKLSRDQIFIDDYYNVIVIVDEYSASRIFSNYMNQCVLVTDYYGCTVHVSSRMYAVQIPKISHPVVTDRMVRSLEVYGFSFIPLDYSYLFIHIGSDIDVLSYKLITDRVLLNAIKDACPN